MADPIVAIEVIDRDAHRAAEEGAPISACPYPPGSSAAYRWQVEYHAKAQELISELTT